MSASPQLAAMDVHKCKQGHAHNRSQRGCLNVPTAACAAEREGQPYQQVGVSLQEHPLQLIRLALLLHAHVHLSLKALGHLALQLPPADPGTGTGAVAYTGTTIATKKTDATGAIKRCYWKK
eukprot:scaffold114526_cov17-Tisochrysis_lutea.AAC.1